MKVPPKLPILPDLTLEAMIQTRLDAPVGRGVLVRLPVGILPGEIVVVALTPVTVSHCESRS